MPVENELGLKEQIPVPLLFDGGDQFLKDAESSEVVSFDFFDTLYIRPLTHPEDAFDIIGKKYGIPNFRSLRRSAQAESFRRMIESGKKEITLEGIYACLPDCGTSASLLMQAEYDLELGLVEPNPEVLPVFLDLLEKKKTVVITSDMYLPECFFKSALTRYGLESVPLFISSTCNATKRDNGELFHVLARRLNVELKDVVHIGDNKLGDVIRPLEVGVKAFHYRAGFLREFSKDISLATSIARGLLYTKANDIGAQSFAEVGFIYGGTANLAFLHWIRDATLTDHIDHVLFLSRDGYSLERMTEQHWGEGRPKHSYLLGSRTAYTLASITSANFLQFIPFFLSGGDGLTPFELLERIGVRPPSSEIMTQLGLGPEVIVDSASRETVSRFLYAYRWEILKVCTRNRIALYQYLRKLGLKDGSRVALVDVGWSGTTQEAFERAVKPLMDISVHGYYLCLADTAERKRRSTLQQMSALISSENSSPEVVSHVYANRVLVEMLFSAPHPSVIGLEVNGDDIVPVFDSGRGGDSSAERSINDISIGIDLFSKSYLSLVERFDPCLQPQDLTAPMLELISDRSSAAYKILSEVKGFDAWGSSINHRLSLKDYI